MSGTQARENSQPMKAGRPLPHTTGEGKMSVAKPCARLEKRHTICAGCVVHKSKNPGRSPASVYINLADRFDWSQIGLRRWGVGGRRWALQVAENTGLLRTSPN